jgi:MFS family permease
MHDRVTDGGQAHGDPSAGGEPNPASSVKPLSTLIRYYILIVLMLASAMSIIDRQILAILIEPVRHDLGLSDSGMGFLTGTAFSAVYTLTCVPVARLADRWSRTRLVAISVGVWSVMTMLCGGAATALQMFVARLGVGIGEAGATAPTHALVGDLFPRHRRGTAMSILTLCAPIGMGAGMAAGGWVLQHYGWRTTFVAAGLPGLALCLLICCTFPRVPKGLSDGLGGEVAEPAPFFRTVRLLCSIRSLPFLMIGGMLATSVIMGATTWLPPFLSRSYHLDQATIGAGLGAALGGGALIGSLGGGPLIDWLGRSDLRWHFWLPTITVPVSGVLIDVALFAPVSSVWPLIGATMLLSALFAGPTLAIAMNLAPVTARGVAAACLAVIVNSMGVAIGPQIVGLLSDLLKPLFGIESLRIAIAGLTALTIPAGIMFWLASWSYRDDLACAEALSVLHRGNGGGEDAVTSRAS